MLGRGSSLVFQLWWLELSSEELFRRRNTYIVLVFTTLILLVVITGTVLPVSPNFPVQLFSAKLIAATLSSRKP